MTHPAESTRNKDHDPHRPPAVKLGLRLLWANLVIGAIYGFGIVAVLWVVVPFERLPPGLFPSLLSGATVALAFGALVVWFIGRGVGWLRWLIVMGVASQFGLAVVPASQSVYAALPLGVPALLLQAGVAAAGLYQLFQPAANEWFRLKAGRPSGTGAQDGNG